MMMEKGRSDIWSASPPPPPSWAPRSSPPRSRSSRAAFTIVLAVSVVRGLRPAILGTVAALAVLIAAVGLFGPLLASVPVQGLQFVIGVLLLVFGLGWLRKAILRAGGMLALHDETAAFAEETASLKGSASDKAADWIAGMAAFKAVLLEGTDVVFIVLAVRAHGRSC